MIKSLSFFFLFLLLFLCYLDQPAEKVEYKAAKKISKLTEIN